MGSVYGKTKHLFKCSKPITFNFQNEAQTASYQRSYTLSLLISSQYTGRGGQEEMWRCSQANTISESLFQACLLLSIPGFYNQLRDTTKTYCCWHDFIKEQSL